MTAAAERLRGIRRVGRRRGRDARRSRGARRSGGSWLAAGLGEGGVLTAGVDVGVTVGDGSGLPVTGSTSVKWLQRYSRTVNPDSWIFAARSRPT